MPLGFCWSPCRKMQLTLGSMSLAVSTTVSGLQVPVTVSNAPEDERLELRQPRPSAPLLAHGQAVASEPSPAQNALLSRCTSYAPMSTIGAVPAPVSATAVSSRKRRLPSRSVVVPAGTAPLSPASAQGENAERCRLPPARLTKSGSAEMFPDPLPMPCTQL